MNEIKLGSVLKIKHGYAFKTENYVPKSRFRLVTLGNFEEGNNSFKYNDSKATYYEGFFPEEVILQPMDLIMPLTEQVIGLFGNSAFIPESEDYTFVLNQRVGKVVANEKKLDKIYAHYLLATKNVKKQLEHRATGTRQRNISPNDVYDVSVILPSVNEQKRIGMLLYSIEEKQKLNNKIISELESMAKTLYDYWFLQFDFPDENGKPYKSYGGKMVYNEELKREIPEGWEVKELGVLFSSNRGVSYNSETLKGEGVPMINLASFTPTGNYNVNGIKSYSGEYSDEKKLKPFDLVMCNTQQTAIDFSKDIIGRAMLVPDIFDGDIVSSHHVTSIKVYNENMKYFLCYLFNSQYFHKYVTGYANGTNILGLLFDGVERYKTEMPTQALLSKFAAVILNAEQKKSLIIKENRDLASLRDFLLPMLMNGQVTFKDAAEVHND